MTRTKIAPKRAESLLFPIARFLLAGGMSRRTAQKSFSSAIKKAQNVAGVRRMDHIGNPTHYADIVALWANDKRFVDGRGRPRALSMDGKNEFGSLVHRVGPNLNKRAVLAVLTRYGNVRRNRNGRYLLVRPYFSTSTPNVMAFEPMAYFLADASSTLSRILKRTKRSRGPELFWRKVESTGLSEYTAKRFVVFARDRSQDFLEELDDWLEAHRAVDAKRPGKRRRVGLGLFSIHSDHEEAVANR